MSASDFHRAAAAALCCVLLAGGCARRSEIAGQVAETQGRIDQAEATAVTVEQSLRSWTEIEPIATGLDQPRGIAIGPEGWLYVAGDSEVRVLNSDGSLRVRFDVPGEPRAIAVGDDSAIYVALTESLLTHRADGTLLHNWDPPGDRNYLTCVALTGTTVYVADAGERAIYVLTGSHVGRIAEENEAAGIPDLIVPSPHMDVAVAPDGNIIVANPGHRQVQTHSPDGALLSKFGTASMEIDGFGGCCNPADLAVLADGRIVTAEKGIPRVKVCNTDGTIESVIALPEDLDTRAKGLDLAVDADDRVLMLDPDARNVRIFVRDEVAQ